MGQYYPAVWATIGATFAVFLLPIMWWGVTCPGAEFSEFLFAEENPDKSMYGVQLLQKRSTTARSE